jgi:hypothetical protein
MRAGLLVQPLAQPREEAQHFLQHLVQLGGGAAHGPQQVREARLAHLRIAPDQQVVAHAQRREQGAAFGREADAEAGAGLQRHTREIDATELQAARGRRLGPRDGLQ